MKLPKPNFKNLKLDGTWLTGISLAIIFLMFMIALFISLINYPVVTLISLTVLSLSRIIYVLFKD